MDLKIKPCVSAWLLDIRHSGEQECSSILLAKPIIPLARNPLNLSVNTSIYEESEPRKSDNLRLEVTESSEAELILGGKIPVGKTVSDSICSEFDSGCGISLSPDDSHCSKIPPSCQDSALNSSENEGSDRQRKTNLRLSGQEEDNSSLDSACGSSPVCNSSQNNSPGRASSPLLCHEINQPIAAVRRAGIPFLPAYANLRDVLDRILLTANRLYSLLPELSRSSNQTEPAFNVVQEFVELAESACCSPFVSYESIRSLKCDLVELNSEFRRDSRCFSASWEFIETVRSFAESVFCFFAKVIVRHLSESGSDNVYLPCALEHMAHLTLFGDEICLEVIQVGGVNCLVRLCRVSGLSTEVLRLSLRSLTVLCGVSKGCVQLLSLGGLELVVKLLREAPFVTAVEAAGILTQLTAPSHSYSALPKSLPKVVSRLLDLCDQSRGADAFLQSSAALANLTMQQSSVSEQLYKENAALRLSKAYNTATCQSIFAQDQIATIFARLSANGYNEALIAQGCIPCLLSLLQIQSSPRHRDLCRRVKHKAAICLGTIAATGYGLKIINENQGTYVLRKICTLDSTHQKSDPVQAISYSLLVRLTQKYETESAV